MYDTQMCFACKKVGGRWRCPLTGRRNGIVLAAGATWLDARVNCPKKRCSTYKMYSETSFVRTSLYTQGERIENYLNEEYNIDGIEITSITLCGETLKPIGRSSSSTSSGSTSSSDDSTTNDAVQKQEADSMESRNVYDPNNGMKNLGDECVDIHPVISNSLGKGEGGFQNCDMTQGLICLNGYCRDDRNGDRQVFNYCNTDNCSPDEWINPSNVGKALWYHTKKRGEVCWDVDNCVMTEEEEAEGNSIYCIAHVCVLAGKTARQALKGEKHTVCLDDTHCFHNKDSKCIYKSAVSAIGSTYGSTHFPTSLQPVYHPFEDENEGKPVKIGVCLIHLSDHRKTDVCVDDSECWKNGHQHYGKKARCDVITHKCVVRHSIEACQPCFDADAHPNAEGFCPGTNRAVYDTCQACQSTKDCKDLPGGVHVECGYPWKSHTALTEFDNADGKVDGKKWAGGEDKNAGKKVCRAKKQGGEACEKKSECSNGKCVLPSNVPEFVNSMRIPENVDGYVYGPNWNKTHQAYQRTTGACNFPKNSPQAAPCMLKEDCDDDGKDDGLSCDLGMMHVQGVSSGELSEWLPLEKIMEYLSKTDIHIQRNPTVETFARAKMAQLQGVSWKKSVSHTVKIMEYLSKTDPHKHWASATVETFARDKVKTDMLKKAKLFGWVDPEQEDTEWSLLGSKKSRKEKRIKDNQLAIRKAWLTLIPDVYFSGTCQYKDPNKSVLAHSENQEKPQNRPTKALNDEPGRCARYSENNDQFLYTGIAYINIETAKQDLKLRSASDAVNPALHVFMFRLPISIKHIALTEFQMVPDQNIDFLTTFSDTCLPLSEQEDKGETIAPEYQSYCESQLAYRDLYKQYHQAMTSEHVERDPCQIIPAIDHEEYVDPTSPFLFFGVALGKYSIDGTKTVRTNKRVFLCVLHNHNVVEDEDGKAGILTRAYMAGKNLFLKGGDFRCLYDHTASVHKDVSTEEQATNEQERVASLDLFDEEMVKQTRAAQALDQVIATVLEKLGTLGDADNQFWKHVYANQIDRENNDRFHRKKWHELETMVGVVDEVGMENIPVQSILTEKAFRLLPRKSTNTMLYGGTLCAKLGWETNCVQYIMPFEDVLKASDPELAKDPETLEQRRNIIKKDLKIWFGEDAEQISAKANSMTTEDEGHSFFFQLFTSAITQNSLDKPGKCTYSEGLKTPETDLSKPGQEKGACEADGITQKYCNLQPDFNPAADHDDAAAELQKKKFNPIDPSGMTCDGVSSKMKQKEERNPQYYYAQRFVDASKCEDLILKDDVTTKKIVGKNDLQKKMFAIGALRGGTLSGGSKADRKKNTKAFVEKQKKIAEKGGWIYTEKDSSKGEE